MELKIVRDMRQGHLRLSTGDRAISPSNSDMRHERFFKFDTGFRDSPIQSPHKKCTVRPGSYHDRKCMGRLGCELKGFFFTGPGGNLLD